MRRKNSCRAGLKSRTTVLESRTKRCPKFVRDLNARIASIENASMSRQLTGAVQRVETASVYGLDHATFSREGNP
jgi:hypothetical protein